MPRSHNRHFYGQNPSISYPGQLDSFPIMEPITLSHHHNRSPQLHLVSYQGYEDVISTRAPPDYLQLQLKKMRDIDEEAQEQWRLQEHKNMTHVHEDKARKVVHSESKNEDIDKEAEDFIHLEHRRFQYQKWMSMNDGR